MYQRLLVPLDGSRLAEAVLPLIGWLAPACQAMVVLLHVIERGAPATVHGEHHLQTTEEAAAYLRGQAERLRAHGIVVETHVHEVPEGDVARSIAAHAQEERADLIVLCTHGSGGIRICSSAVSPSRCSSVAQRRCCWPARPRQATRLRSCHKRCSSPSTQRPPRRRSWRRRRSWPGDWARCCIW